MANTSLEPQFSDHQSLMAGYVLGDLSPEEGRALQQLLETDASLRVELTALQESLEAVYGEESAPPPSLKQSLLAAVEQSTLGSNVPDELPKLPAPVSAIRRFRLLAAGLGTLAAGVIAALGIQNYTLRQTIQVLRAEQLQAEQLQTEQTQAEQATSPYDRSSITVALEPTEPSPEQPPVDLATGTVSLVLDPAELRARLKAEGLPTLSPDQVYVLWTVVKPNTPATTDHKDAILTTVFTVDDSGNQTQEIALPSVFEDVNSVKAVAISIESSTAPEEHEASPILIKQL